MGPYKLQLPVPSRPFGHEMFLNSNSNMNFFVSNGAKAKWGEEDCHASRIKTSENSEISYLSGCSLAKRIKFIFYFFKKRSASISLFTQGLAFTIKGITRHLFLACHQKNN